MPAYIVPIVFCAALAAQAAAAGQPRIHIHGPKGCSYLDGLGGDGAAFHALDEEHMILDHEVLESTKTSCYFDGAFSLIGEAGKTEELTGTCENHEGGKREGTFTLTYSDADHAMLEFGGFDEPVPFTACDWP